MQISPAAPGKPEGRLPTLRRLATALLPLAALAALGAPAAPAQSPNASCVAHIVRSPVGPPGGAQSQVHFNRFGRIVSHVARAEGTSFEECLPALEEALAP